MITLDRSSSFPQQLLLKAGEPVQIGAREFEILAFLAERAGDLRVMTGHADGRIRVPRRYDSEGQDRLP
jgi:hypothetical protein